MKNSENILATTASEKQAYTHTHTHTHTHTKTERERSTQFSKLSAIKNKTFLKDNGMAYLYWKLQAESHALTFFNIKVSVISSPDFKDI